MAWTRYSLTIAKRPARYLELFADGRYGPGGAMNGRELKPRRMDRSPLTESERKTAQGYGPQQQARIAAIEKHIREHGPCTARDLWSKYRSQNVVHTALFQGLEQGRFVVVGREVHGTVQARVYDVPASKPCK